MSGDALVDELKLAFDQALEAARQAEAAWQAEAKRIHYIQPGDILAAANGDRAKVTRLTMKYGEIKVEAVLRNKDGQFGKRIAPLWRREWSGDWSNPRRLFKAEMEPSDVTT